MQVLQDLSNDPTLTLGSRGWVLPRKSQFHPKSNIQIMGVPRGPQDIFLDYPGVTSLNSEGCAWEYEPYPLDNKTRQKYIRKKHQV